MKKIRLIGFASGIIAFAFTMPSASAVTYYFDADGNVTAATGGDGTWDGASLLWRNGIATGFFVCLGKRISKFGHRQPRRQRHFDAEQWFC